MSREKNEAHCYLDLEFMYEALLSLLIQTEIN